MLRTMTCGAMRAADVGREATLCGWVSSVRDMGGVLFIDLRDREGVTQLVVDEGRAQTGLFALAAGLRPQTVVRARGSIAPRDESTYNPAIATGEAELRVASLEVLSPADPLPFPIDDYALPREDVRLKYRYLDLRRPAMQRALRFRHQVMKAAEAFLDEAGFLCVETPMLAKSTPEGAREYLVPSRVKKGAYYALPQSPQIFKQLLMVGGVDRYYQIARCFRDEDLRADRQPEFTQVDMEMSFVEQEDILLHLERLFKHIFVKTMGREIDCDFPRLTWREAMDTYGSDKPDLRFGLPIVDVTAALEGCSFSVFQKAIQAGGVVRAINAKGCASFTRKEIEALTAAAQELGAKGMAWLAIRADGSINSILPKYFTEADLRALLEATGAAPGDFVLFCADKLDIARRVLGGLRLRLGDMLGLRDKSVYRFLIVTEFPQFEYSETEGRYLATHHPFTMPYEDDLPYLLTDPGRVRAQAYDFVLNGVELGSGSIRIHRPDVQRLMFQALGFDDTTIQSRFGFMVDAFRYGTPPHGGFAFGLDRLVMLLLGADSLREVIAFPKLKDASCPLTSAPDFVDEKQLAILGQGMPSTGETPKTRRADGEDTHANGIDVARVAHLARLRLTEEEMRAMEGQLQRIVDFAGALQAVDTSGVEEEARGESVLRPDLPQPSLPREALLAETYFQAPRAAS